jgi:hypothetical protein
LLARKTHALAAGGGPTLIRCARFCNAEKE